MNKPLKHLCTMVLPALLAVLTAACHRDIFDAQTYEELMEAQQPTDSIDQSHTWTLSATHQVYVDAASLRIGTQRVQILTGNPTQDEDVTVVADQPMADGQQKYVKFSAPVTLSTFYAALVDADGRYTVQRFAANGQNPSVDFTSPVARRAAIGTRQLNQQSYTYCFEEEMPEPGDYDFNDVVLRIGQRQTASNQITLDVTLVAVGTQQKVAAAIRLMDYGYNDIVSVETEDGESFDTGIKHYQYDAIGSEQLLLDGLHHEAVLNLFEDAHWATGQAYYTSQGLIERFFYNVSKGTSYDYDIIAPRTVSYVITFRNESFLNYFTLDAIDPFIIVDIGGLFMEVHSNFANRETPVLRDFKMTSTTKALPWALVIPTNTFRHPLQGVNMGYYKDGALFGAFMTEGHAFGEWVRSKEQSRDWYNYPTSNQVF